MLHKATPSVPSPGVLRFSQAHWVADFAAGGLPDITSMQGAWLWSARFRAGAFQQSSDAFTQPTTSPSPSAAPPHERDDATRQAVHIILVRQVPQLSAVLLSPDWATVCSDLCRDLDATLAQHGPLTATLSRLLCPLDFIPQDAHPLAPSAAGPIQRWISAAQYEMCLSCLDDSPWLLDASRTLFLAAAGRDEQLTVTMTRFAQDDRAGPLLCLAVAEVLDQLALPALAQRVAAGGMSRLDERHWQGDLVTLHAMDVGGWPMRSLLHHPDAVSRILAPQHPLVLEAALRACSQPGAVAAAWQVVSSVIWHDGERDCLAQHLAMLAGTGTSGKAFGP